jgi:hypothetical protein
MALLQFLWKRMRFEVGKVTATPEKDLLLKEERGSI